MGLRVRAAALAVVLIAPFLACTGPREAEAARSAVEQLALDSLSGDSAALATLPPALSAWLDVQPYLADSHHAALTLHECRELHSPSPELVRRRLRLRIADTTALVLYTVSDRATGALERVEFVRRSAQFGQRGIVWDGERNRTVSTWWRETPWGRSRRVERGEIPRGGPVPRALRGLGRQLLLIDCAPSGDDAPAITPD